MALIIDIKVVPNSGKSLLKCDKIGMLVCYLKSVPERGLANKELIAYLATLLKFPKQSISIIKGLASRRKRVHIETMMSQEELFAALGIEQQMHIY